MVSAQDPKLEPRPNEVIVFTLTVPAIFMLGVTSGVISKGRITTSRLILQKLR